VFIYIFICLFCGSGDKRSTLEPHPHPYLQKPQKLLEGLAGVADKGQKQPCFLGVHPDPHIKLGGLP
jgi:hypothetical protein